jgi:hydroxypyruvate reductase
MFAQTTIHSLVLSDVLGDRLDSIASGPAYPDSSTCEEALSIIDRYGLTLRPELREILKKETPHLLGNVQTRIIGSIGRASKLPASLPENSVMNQ